MVRAINRILLLFVLQLCGAVCMAQSLITMRTMWDRPQVHVKFGVYTLSFRIQDIDKALAAMAEVGDSTYSLACGLDTNGNYLTELYDGNMQYRATWQKMLHNDIGAFLLTARRAYITAGKRKVIPAVVADVQLPDIDLGILHLRFYDPKTQKLIFAGTMRKDLWNKDLGLD